MENRNARLEERIKSVQVSFVASLPGYIVDISHRWKMLRHTSWDAHIAQELQTFAHRLAGSGGTFGFPDISRTASVLDVSLGEALGIKDDIPPEKMVVIEGQVDDLVRVLKSVLASREGASTALPLLTSRVADNQGLVVIIDDDKLLRDRISVLLEDVGYHVAVFSEPSEAIALLQEQQPVLVLLDLMFPGQHLPAFGVVARIRGETGVRTPVAVMSGRADFRSRLQATRAGADAYLVKPLEDKQLVVAVQQLTARPSNDSWRCLVVDDDEILAQQLVEWLREAGMVAEWEAAPRDSWLRVRDFRPDVLILDVKMPECNGIEFATMLRQDISTSQLPIVFLTSDDAERTRRNAMAAGADDYLLKPIDRATLIKAVIARARLSKRIQDQVGRVTQQSPQGAGLSRHYFFNEFERVLDDADEGSVQSALVLIGLVQAPDVLQKHGALGLAALQEQFVARLISTGITTWSMLGENIVGLLLPRDTSLEQQNKVKTLVYQLATQPYVVNSINIDSGACAATLHLRSAQAAAATILLQAEQMLSMAIEAGAGTVLDGFIGISERVETTGHLPLNRLRMVYQPIVTITDEGHPVSTVLARLTDSEGNLLPAGQFLSALEKRGWLPELDAWVFRSAHQVLTTQIESHASQCLIVHASPRSLNSAIYLETVIAVLTERPMRNASQCLVVAIPETTAVTHRQSVERLNEALKAAGCGLMLTNYGASATSITVLEQLKPLYVRLDDAVTRRLEKTGFEATDRELIQAAEKANAIVVAGGIESASSLSGLWAKGIRWFQGYFIQEPASTLHPVETDG